VQHSFSKHPATFAPYLLGETEKVGPPSINVTRKSIQLGLTLHTPRFLLKKAGWHHDQAYSGHFVA